MDKSQNVVNTLVSTRQHIEKKFCESWQNGHSHAAAGKKSKKNWGSLWRLYTFQASKELTHFEPEVRLLGVYYKENVTSEKDVFTMVFTLII